MQSLVKSSMDVCLFLFSFGWNYVVRVPAHAAPRFFIKTKIIVGYVMFGLRACGSRFMFCRGFIALHGCVRFHNKLSLIYWSPFAVFNNRDKSGSDGTHKNTSSFNIVLWEYLIVCCIASNSPHLQL